ncbi:hypothetical protein CEG14_09110 [Bordetella genomosp. 1]|uniref:BON domain-containing protein n=2 Tax=Bordetella genomosp. 1 TaxID=1395607 RepID=A0A261SCY1_9BORD|nr:hypothetical protein CEG14_09110 [Bordetella genomosp. 1]
MASLLLKGPPRQRGAPRRARRWTCPDEVARGMPGYIRAGRAAPPGAPAHGNGPCGALGIAWATCRRDSAARAAAANPEDPIMKQTLFCLTRPLAAALLCGALAAPAIAATPQDAMLTTQVREALALRAGLESNTIGVRTEAGVVQLEGQVENDEVAARALDAASDVQGVREVRSLLVVRRAL